jgi:hypothetical protein
MPGHECYHCKQWVDEGEAHDCWTTTEAALTSELTDDLREAWERLREAAAGVGEQRIYASHSAIMFSRKACYFFVRPKRNFLELTLFLGRGLSGPQVRRAMPASKTKIANVVHVTHRDQVEAPLTDWIQEAYEFGGAPAVNPVPAPKRAAIRTTAVNAGTKARAKQQSPASAKTAVKKKVKAPRKVNAARVARTSKTRGNRG